MVYVPPPGVPHNNQWKVGMCSTPCVDPGKFCYACLCPCIFAFQQRRTLIGNGEYYCCMRAFPFCCLANPCPQECLCLEVVCCTTCAVTANRGYIQGSKQLVNSPCDDCLIWLTCLCQCAICIAEIAGYQVDPSIKNAVDCFFWTVLGCMQTQQALEIDPTFNPPPKQVMQ